MNAAREEGVTILNYIQCCVFVSPCCFFCGFLTGGQSQGDCRDLEVLF